MTYIEAQRILVTGAEAKHDGTIYRLVDRKGLCNVNDPENPIPVIEESFWDQRRENWSEI